MTTWAGTTNRTSTASPAVPPPRSRRLGGKPDEQDRVEAVAVPGDDLTEPAAEALVEETEDLPPAERRH